MNWRLVSVWLVALLAATAFTWQIVSIADSRVGEAPVAVFPSVDSSSTSGTSSSSPSTPTSTSTSETTSSSSTQTSTTTTTTTPTSPTSSPPQPSTSTTEPTWTVKAIASAGGTVVVRYGGDQVELISTTPAPGFAVEVDDSGPDRVRVEFAGPVDDIRVEARWRDGELEVEISD